jgi:alkaline phosphatase
VAEFTRREAIEIFGATLATLLINPTAHASQIGGMDQNFSFEKTDKPGIIFIVGDGMPVSTLTALYRLRQNVGTKMAFYKRF